MQAVGEVALESIEGAQGLSRVLQQLAATLFVHEATLEGVRLSLHIINRNPDAVTLINPLDTVQYIYLSEQGLPIGQLHAAPRLLINTKDNVDDVIRENFAAIEILEDGQKKDTAGEIARRHIDIEPDGDYQLNLKTLPVAPLEDLPGGQCRFVLFLSMTRLEGENSESRLLQSRQVDIELST
jgi:hypothetical protein